MLFTSCCSGFLCLPIQALASLAHTWQHGLCLCFPVAMMAVFAFSLSVLAVLFLCLVVVLLPFVFRRKRERAAPLMESWRTAESRHCVLFPAAEVCGSGWAAQTAGYVETTLHGLGFCWVCAMRQRLAWSFRMQAEWTWGE